jgi:hypothetical protein
MKADSTAKLLFTEAALPYILRAFGKTIDANGLIVEPNGDPVLTPEGEEIKATEFGGIKKGSEIFIKDDLYSIMQLAEGNY